MRLRLPFFKKKTLPLGPGIPEPKSAITVIDPEAVDPPGWYEVDPCESVRKVPAAAAEPAGPAASDDAAEAGYRWGSTHAQGRCDLSPPRETTEVVSPGGQLPAARIERTVLAVAARTEVLASVVTRLYDRLEEVSERLVDVVTHEELIELESRRARLAAEVSRLSVELKAEMDRRLSELGRAIATANHRSATVDHRGPLDIAEDRRVELHLDRIGTVDDATVELAEAMTEIAQAS